MIEGSGSVPLTNGSGSRRPKNYGSAGSGSATLIFMKSLKPEERKMRQINFSVTGTTHEQTTFRVVELFRQIPVSTSSTNRTRVGSDFILCGSGSSINSFRNPDTDSSALNDAFLQKIRKTSFISLNYLKLQCITCAVAVLSSHENKTEK
jgi:hypothetical protein